MTICLLVLVKKLLLLLLLLLVSLPPNLPETYYYSRSTGSTTLGALVLVKNIAASCHE